MKINRNKKMIDFFKKEGEDEKKKRVIRARSKEKREILNLKRELINEVFKLAEKEISSLNKEEYLTLLKNSLFANIDSGDKEIVFSPEDKRLIEGEFINNLKNREKRIKISYGLDKRNADKSNLFQLFFILKRRTGNRSSEETI